MDTSQRRSEKMGFNFEEIERKIRFRSTMTSEEIIKQELEIVEQERLQREKDLRELLEKKYGIKLKGKDIRNED